jgi:hypothetical protein
VKSSVGVNAVLQWKENTMRSLLMAVTVASALAATGCTDVLSLNPWVEGEGLMDPQFAGSWSSGDGGDGDVFVIQAVENEKYDVRYASEKESTRFEGRLLAAGGARFFDLIPTKGESSSLFAWPSHALVKVWFEGEDLNFAFVDSEWFRQLAGNLAVPMQKIDSAVLLTAPTATLSGSLLQYAAYPQAVSEGGEFRSGTVKLHRLK